jgi:hypothetical protein
LGERSSEINRPNPLVSLFNFHYSRPPDSVALNRKLACAIGDNETGFDGAADATYRVQGWDFLMAGGALYNNLDYSFAVGYEDGTLVPTPETPGGGGRVLRRQLGELRAFFDEIPFWRMGPAAAGTAGGPDGATTRALEEPGKWYAVYVHHGRAVKDGNPKYQVDTAPRSRQVRLRLPPGRYTAAWRDTQSGAHTNAETFTSNGPGESRTLDSPPYSGDIALLVRAADGNK